MHTINELESELQLNATTKPASSASIEVGFAEKKQVFDRPPLPVEMASEAPITKSPSASVQLDFESLDCFEAVGDRFAERGVVFNNAIALHPSNPAFPTHSGSMVMIGAPKAGWLEVNFQCPVQAVSGYVTSSRRTLLIAYDAEDNLLAKDELPSSNLAGSDSKIAPNRQLSLKTPNIHRVAFQSLGGQLTVDDLSFKV
ncbi:MAG: hypothetical protein F6K19_10080 [Cyanothece sp. SIO1E1]|nr:hypothetical protein [Cyanothece sp. SIO1E1]